MKKLWETIKHFKWGYLLFALLFAGSGLCFLCFPEDALNGVRIGIGVTAVVFAGIYIALTIANPERGFRFWAKMVMAGVCVVCGGFIIFCSQGAFAYLTFAAGLYLLIDGAFKLQTAILSKRYKSAVWWIMLVLAASAISLGTVMVRVRFDFSEELVKVSKILGVGLLIDGLQNFLSIGYLYFVEHKTKRAIVEELRAEGKMVTVVEEEEQKEKDLSRAGKKAQKAAKKAALASEASVASVDRAADPVPASAGPVAPEAVPETYAATPASENVMSAPVPDPDPVGAILRDDSENGGPLSRE